MPTPIGQKVGTAVMRQAQRLRVKQINPQQGRHPPSVQRNPLRLIAAKHVFDAICGQRQHEDEFQSRAGGPAVCQYPNQPSGAAATRKQILYGKLCHFIA